MKTNNEKKKKQTARGVNTWLSEKASEKKQGEITKQLAIFVF